MTERITDTAMIERIWDTLQIVLEKQDKHGELLAKVPGMVEKSINARVEKHEKSCSKKGVSIFRLQAPFVFNITAFIAVILLVINGYKAFESTKTIATTNTSTIEILKHTFDSHKTELHKTN